MYIKNIGVNIIGSDKKVTKPNEGGMFMCDNYFRGNVKLNENADICEAEITLQTEDGYALASKDSVYADIFLDREIKDALSRKMNSPFWTSPEFETDFSKLSYDIQNMLIKTEDDYVAVLPLCNDSFISCIGASDDKSTIRLYLSKFFEGSDSLGGIAAVFAKDKNPHKAVEKAYEYAAKEGYIKTKLKREKKLDEMYYGFGWCTWDAFYKEVSEENILKKLEEFKTKNIPVKWVMIDDGWSTLTGENLTVLRGFEADSTKFPNGLGGCIKRLKEEYGIEKVGVWHAFTGCWNGVEYGSDLYEKQKQNLVKSTDGYYIPNGKKAYDFFDSWYTYLKSQGVDFVKIDAQGCTPGKIMNKDNFSKRYIDMHLAVEEAAKKHFDSNVINCMGMSNADLYFRPYTSLARNSDDFYPNKENGFETHIMQNAYNTVFHRNLFYCDFDMWWTTHINAKQSSVLRAISGGPIYVSDKIGESSEEFIAPLTDDNGRLLICDNAALPTDDCLFKDCSGDVLKIYNTVGDEGVVAIFNLSDEKKSVSVGVEDFGGNGDFAAYGYFEQKFRNKKTFDIELEPQGTEIFNFYKAEDGKVRIGDMTKYISLATERKRIVNIAEFRSALGK